MRLHNLRAFTPRRRELRAHLTPAEARLWNGLKRSQLRGKKFRRQHSVGPYVLDFYCPLEKLAIELDGAAHDSEPAQRHDQQRDRFLKDLGIRVVRFQNEDVIRNVEGVLAEIEKLFEVARCSEHPGAIAPPLLDKEGSSDHPAATGGTPC